MRREADLDHAQSVYVAPNGTRNQAIATSKTIFNTIIDSMSDSCTASDVITHLFKFEEEEWAKFQKDQSSVDEYAEDKLGYIFITRPNVPRPSYS